MLIWRVYFIPSGCRDFEPSWNRGTHGRVDRLSPWAGQYTIASIFTLLVRPPPKRRLEASSPFSIRFNYRRHAEAICCGHAKTTIISSGRLLTELTATHPHRSSPPYCGVAHTKWVRRFEGGD